MCIISPPEVEEISNTTIFIAPVINNRQLTVYSNTVEVDNPVAMILPFPVTNRKGAILAKDSNKTFEFVDFSNYENLFDDLESLFPKFATRGLSKGFDSFDCDDNYSLDVVDVGNYKASVAFSLDDLKRLKFDVFNLTPDVVELMSTHYKDNYGFVVCIMTESKKYHPFGYIHDMRDDMRYFVPTRHYHNTHDDLYHADWDHSIYIMNCDEEQIMNCRRNYEIDTKLVNFKNSAFLKELINPLLGEGGNDQLCLMNNGFTKLPKNVVLPKLNNCGKITINMNWHYNHDLVLNSSLTKKTEIYIASDGCSFLNSTDLKINYKPYGFRTLIEIDGKHMKHESIEGPIHLGGPGCIFRKKDDNSMNKYYMIDDVGMACEKSYGLNIYDNYVELVDPIETEK